MRETENPIILREGAHEHGELDRWRERHQSARVRDVYESQLHELFDILHPSSARNLALDAGRESFVSERMSGQEGRIRGAWVYYPWSETMVHLLPPDEYFLLRTNRNRNLITEEEQQRLRSSTIGIAGLSVGSNVALSCMFSGIGSNWKLAEFDHLETTNLNRIRARVEDVGLPKLAIVARQLYETDPFASIIPFSEGMNRETLLQFATAVPKVDLLFEIIDSFEMKIHLRSLARKERIPVIMVTNLGDRVLIDAERYDRDPATPYFNGRAGSVPEEILERPDITSADKHRYAVSLAGVDHIPERARQSVEEIGKTLCGRPQLASTVTVAAGYCAYLARRILLGDDISGSWLIDLDRLFDAHARL